MRIVLDATREEYVAWLRAQPADRVLQTYETSNPLSVFVLAYVVANSGIRGYDRDYPLQLMTYLRQERQELGGQWYCDLEIEHEEHEEHDFVGIGITLPDWMQPLATLYRQPAPGQYTTISLGAAIADAEALAGNDEPPPGPDRIIFRSGGGATSRVGGIA